VPYVKRVSRKRPLSREETKQKTREALIEAALESFAREGLDASLDGICERAGFTRGAFYVHFADREELLVAVMDHVGEKFLASVFAGLTGAEPGSLRTVAERFLTAVSDGSYPLLAKGRPMVKMHQLLDACARSPKVRERYRGLVEMSIASLAGLMPNEPNGVAIGQLLLATIIGAQTMSELGVELDIAVLGAQALRLLHTAE